MVCGKPISWQKVKVLTAKQNAPKNWCLESFLFGPKEGHVNPTQLGWKQGTPAKKLPAWLVENKGNPKKAKKKKGELSVALPTRQLKVGKRSGWKARAFDDVDPRCSSTNQFITVWCFSLGDMWGIRPLWEGTTPI